MRKVLIAVLGTVISWSFMFGDAFDNMTNDIASLLNKAANSVSTEMKKHMGFYTGSGNVFPANTSGFPGIKLGLGLGVVLPSSFFSFINDASFLKPDSSSYNIGMIDDLASAAGGAFFPYDLIYGKIGIPMIDMDVGIRLGYIPRIDLEGKLGETGYKIGTDAFHFGIEGRYLLFKDPTGIVKVDARLSGDFDYGSLLLGSSYTAIAYDGTTTIGTNENDISFGYQWGGSSIGLKLVGGLNIPLVGSVFAGIGGNLNFGSVTTTLGYTAKFKPNSSSGLSEQKFEIEGKSEQPYDLFDLRVMVGLHIFIINFGFEYNIMNGDMAFTLIPVSITF